MENMIIPDAGYMNGIAQTERVQELSEDQRKAIDFVIEFLMDGKRRHAVIGGCAGTGKSTVIPYVIQKCISLGKRCCVCAYTGKAVMVLKRKGMIYASTLHSFLYRCRFIKNSDGEVSMEFVEKSRVEFEGIDLLIVDEASMLNREMFEIIEGLPFKTIYIGDHFQLPPVKDDFNIMKNPDFKMERILRQRENDPIVKMATLARNGENIPLGIWGDSSHIMKLDMKKMIEYDEILTWTNKARDTINKAVRFEMGRPFGVPVMEEKMLVRSNNPSKNVYNGQLVYLMRNPIRKNNGAWRVEYVDEIAYNDPFVMAQTDEYMSADASVGLSKMEVENYRLGLFSAKDKQEYRKRLKYQIHLDWGYCLTVHAAQGSSWENVAVIVENRMKYMDMYSRWLYTAITRAEKSITLITGNFNWNAIEGKIGRI